MAVKLNGAGRAHAASLIAAGKVDKGDTWSKPSPEEEDAYIKKHGMSEFGKHFLAIHTENDPKSKSHYGYPICHLGGDVSRKGIISAEQRAGGQGATSIAEAAKNLLNKIDGKHDTKAYMTVDSKGRLLFD